MGKPSSFLMIIMATYAVSTISAQTPPELGFYSKATTQFDGMNY